MTLKLTSREKLLGANAIGTAKLALVAEDYPQALNMIDGAIAALEELRKSIVPKQPVAVVTGGIDGKGNVTTLKKDT